MTTKSLRAYILRGSVAAMLVSCVVVALASAINLPGHRPTVPARENSAGVGVTGHEGAASDAAPAILTHRTLTFADRIAYQRGIEEVYWRHRIWPKANARPKPPLDKVMSQAQIEKKVEDYLRDSQALEDYWQRPITPDQLQAEIERIASHTKQPGVLRELFAALGDDPFLIAECLARPVLAERLITELYAHDQRFHGELKRRAEAELRAHQNVSEMKQTSGTYTEMEWIRSDSAKEDSALGDAKSVGAVKMNSSEWQESVVKLAKDLGFGVRRQGAVFESADSLARSKRAAASDEYKTLPVGKLSALQEDDAHYYAVAVMKKGKDRLKLATVAWLKEPLRSWLAKAEKQAPVTMAAVSPSYYTLPMIGRPLVNSKPSGSCTDDTWTPTSLAGAPAGRKEHTAVWTGSEMIVWGGDGSVSPGIYNTGGRYDPSTDSWTATSTSNAPSARYLHTAVWTGSEMIIWGGNGNGDVNTGGRYNPGTDSWTATSTGTYVPAAREAHTAVWTGSEMIVWGGYEGVDEHFFNDGGRYDPSTDSWTPTSTTSAPDGRLLYTAVWTGSEMIVWGGVNPSGYLSTGGRYNPGTDSWIPTGTTNAPAGRQAHTALWTGSEMIVWGGLANGGDLNTGGRYNPAADSWTATSTTGAPSARDSHTAVWTGSEMIVWGGFTYGSPPFYLNTGGRYDPSTDSWTVSNTAGAPSIRDSHTAIFTGSQMIVWGGLFSDGINFNYLNTGGRYCAGIPGPTPTPTATPTASPTPTPTATATPAGACADDTWTATTTVNAPDARGGHTGVWTGSEMIIWSGENFDGGRINNLSTGGRYNPAEDTWTATGTTNAPLGRTSQAGVWGVWTGSEVIVWGAYNYPVEDLNTGGRYTPSTDSWTPTSTTNAPFARDDHTAVWTGTEMIVWGGANNVLWTNTGGRYNPATDSWTATNPWYTPEARWGHTAVWTGSEMIVWGGTDVYHPYLNTGGRYNPETDSWTPTSLVNAPLGRVYHTAIWSGSEMIVWGGVDSTFNDCNTGGRYNPSSDTWTATSTIGVPAARDSHTAVCTGSEMIVWGGEDISGFANTGGRYNPGTDSWIPISTTNAPHGRYDHTAVWTGNEMIIWGGAYVVGNNTFFLNTGGRYCAQSGATPTPTPTLTATATATPTATSTATATATATATPATTPRPRETPRPRPTPPPRP